MFKILEGVNYKSSLTYCVGSDGLLVSDRRRSRCHPQDAVACNPIGWLQRNCEVHPDWNRNLSHMKMQVDWSFESWINNKFTKVTTNIISITEVITIETRRLQLKQ